MLYLVDPNIFIRANREYYPISRIPEFWDWLVQMAEDERVKVPEEMYGQVDNGRDDLAQWARSNKDVLLLQESVDTELVRRALAIGYAPDLNDAEIEEIGLDFFLIAYALADNSNRTAVSNEISKTTQRRGRRKLPDACDSLQVRHISVFDLIRELDFRTRR